MDSPALTPLRLNGRTVDLQRGAVTDGGGHTVTLRPQAGKVMKLLATRPGKLISNDELIQSVWGSIAVTDDSLVQCIKEIRKALGDENHKIVRTVLKRGYILELPRPEFARGPQWRRWTALATCVAGLATLAGVYLLPTKSGTDPPSIAVMPFESVNGDEKWERFADAITDDIITDLARFRAIPVIASASTATYRDGPHDVREIGKTLNVRYVLEGSLQIDGHRLRVATQLTNTGTGEHVWSERYDRNAGEFFEVQDEITGKIVSTLTGYQGQLTAAERALAKRKNSTDLNAYDYWILGVEAKQKLTPESEIEARSLFEKGLKLAPDFAPLSRDLSYVYAIEVEVLGSAKNPAAALSISRKLAAKALTLDPYDALTHHAWGTRLRAMGDVAGAERHFKRALELGPNNSDVLILVAWDWAQSGQPERAIEMVDRALRLNPSYPHWWNNALVAVWFPNRFFEKAYGSAQAISGNSPNDAARYAMIAAQLGKEREASEAAAAALEMNPQWTAESMLLGPLADESLLPESARKAGLPVCMTASQLESYEGSVRFRECEAMRLTTANR
ncbi:winged helix-turn-helix domain-containing protein [Mesorhizobium sp. WSM2239]|uniref:Winged helix-turn-helix domain-containing protein n=2 Tax=unclassified Mesorhizobium TaxID=325217 RepID=A0AAU8DIL8_9HYPH